MTTKRIQLKQDVENEPPFHIYETGVAKNYSVYISEAIDAPNLYTHLFSFLRNAMPHDSITMYINSPGGNLSTGLQLITSINECQATVRTVLDGVAASLAPLILFAGHEIIINDNAMIMFHDYSTENYGKGNEIKSSAEAYEKLYKKLLKCYAHPFLSTQEIDQITRGQDFYFDSDEIIERLEKLTAPTNKKRKTRKKEI